jgi:hypothetical protein
MSGIQKDKKVAVKGCNNEVIQSQLILLETSLSVELIKAQSKIKRLIGVNQTQFNLVFLLLSIAEPINITKLGKLICLGYNVFYRDVIYLEKKGLIGIYKQGRIIYYFATLKSYDEFSQFYPSFKFKQPKTGQFGT